MGVDSAKSQDPTVTTSRQRSRTPIPPGLNRAQVEGDARNAGLPSRLSRSTEDALDNAAWHGALDLAELFGAGTGSATTPLRRTLQRELRARFGQVMADVARELGGQADDSHRRRR